MRSSYLASVDFLECHAVEVYSSLGLTRVKYNINKPSRVEKEYVIVRIMPNILTDVRNYSLYARGNNVLNRVVPQSL
jgi:hypothetical protein